MIMKRFTIQVIGLGVVGVAHAFLASWLNDKVYGYDIDPKAVELAHLKVPEITPVKKFKRRVDMTFICTPEDKVESIIRKLLREKVRGLYVVRSTLPAGSTLAMMKKYGVHITYNPEFLRENFAFEDIVKPSRIVIGGCCSKHYKLLETFYSPLKAKTYFTTPTTAEMIKLVSNALRSLMISFWNELYLLSMDIPFNIRELAEAADPGKVIGEWEGGHWGTRYFGQPYGGKCLPKDTQHLIKLFKKYGVPEYILRAAERVNKLL